MEKNPNKPILQVSEIRPHIESAEETLQNSDIDIQRCIDELEFVSHKLDGLLLDNEMLVSEKELHEYQITHDIPEEFRVENRYSSLEEKEIHVKIITMLAKIHVYMDRINSLHESREEIEDTKQKLIELEQTVNELLTRIPQEQLN